LVNNITTVDDGFSGRVMPAIGLDYRYPFVADFGGLGVHTLEPIAQVIARPSETRIGRLPNEDAQSPRPEKPSSTVVMLFTKAFWKPERLGFTKKASVRR
jgi:hypothetical protein